jgi:fructokinase
LKVDNKEGVNSFYDVVAIGELLIDFTPHGISAQGNTLFERNPGGAPANVLAALSRFGKKTAFIGKVGSDQFGHFLQHTLEQNLIETKGLVFSDEVNTTLAFVHIAEDGDRQFSFYRKPGADLTLREDEVNFELIGNAEIFHFGSVSMTEEPSRSVTIRAVEHAKRRGKLISYDPNLRESLWPSLELAKIVISEGLRFADVLKVSEEELYFLTECRELEDGCRWLGDRYGIPAVFVTLGSKGCYYNVYNHTGTVPGFVVAPVDSTGAGDAFLGAILYQLLDSPDRFSTLTEIEIRDCVQFANAAGALATQSKGAIPSLPNLQDVENLLKGS